MKDNSIQGIRLDPKEQILCKNQDSNLITKTPLEISWQGMELLITQMLLKHCLSALFHLHLHPPLNTWCQWIGLRQLQDLVSMDWAKTTTKRDDKLLSFGIWCGLYYRFDGKCSCLSVRWFILTSYINIKSQCFNVYAGACAGVVTCNANTEDTQMHIIKGKHF